MMRPVVDFTTHDNTMTGTKKEDPLSLLCNDVHGPVVRLDKFLLAVGLTDVHPGEAAYN